MNCNRWLAEKGWLSYASADHDELAAIADDADLLDVAPALLDLMDVEADRSWMGGESLLA